VFFDNANDLDINDEANVEGCSVWWGPQFIEIYAESWGNVGLMDRESFDTTLRPTAPLDEVAQNVLSALAASKQWSPTQWAQSNGFVGSDVRRRQWISEMLNKIPAFKGRKSELFTGLRWMHVRRRGTLYAIVPKRRVKGDGYGFILNETGGTLVLYSDANDVDFRLARFIDQGYRACIA
jgi:hypothetical protein